MVDDDLIGPGCFDFEPLLLRRRILQGLGPDTSTVVVSSPLLCGNAKLNGGRDGKLMADRIRSAFPSARVLIVVREQVSWLVSFYKMEVALNGGVEKPRGLFGGAGPLDGYSRFDLSFLHYDKIVRYYQGLLGSESVLILPFENIQQSPTGFVENVLEFAGLRAPDGFDAGSTAINKGMELGSVAVQRFLNRMGLGRRCLPQVVVRLLGSVLMRSSLSADEAPLIFRRIAGDRFKQSNLELQRLVSFDLKALGYAL